ncbi:class D sortase [Brevibacillus daliensis]|uniref:class D sortase n=1 Tax=Brevibacillus daliensis TaxID=2892995 RepID=UPI001E491C29|nr:class D sortase [Brevibacillus daliensis]
MKRKVVSVLLIVVGLFIIGYPKLSEIYYDYKQQELVKEWQTSFTIIQNVNDTSQSNSEIEIEKNALAGVTSEKAVDQERKSMSDFSGYENMEGILRIDEIDLQLPILHGATDHNMKTTVASIENTGKAGEVGNYAIAGHRNYTYGRNFNRLDEMKMGDTIEVDNGEQQFEYIVTEKLYVKPEDVWVLKGNGENKEITLVTCHPMENPTHRLIIKGKILDSEAAQSPERG